MVHVLLSHWLGRLLIVRPPSEIPESSERLERNLNTLSINRWERTLLGLVIQELVRVIMKSCNKSLKYQRYCETTVYPDRQGFRTSSEAHRQDRERSRRGASESDADLPELISWEIILISCYIMMMQYMFCSYSQPVVSVPALHLLFSYRVSEEDVLWR